MIHGLLAASGGLDLPTNSKVPGLVASDMVLIFSLATLIFGGIIAWVVFVRGPKKHPSERRPPPASAPPKVNVTITEDGMERVRKKKRARRREHRQINPTLSQTGGLPPPRDPGQVVGDL